VGVQTVTVRDKVNASIAGSTTITVAGPPFTQIRFTGQVFEDLVQDGFGPGLPNQTVFLDLNQNGQLDPGEPSTVTDSQGSYSLTINGAGGTFTLRGVINPGTITTQPASASITLNAVPGPTIGGQNFGIVLTSPIVPLRLLSFPFLPSANPSFLYIAGLYRTLLGREPEPFGSSFWSAILNSPGGSPQMVARGIWDSPEHRGLEVDSYYATYLHRAPDPMGRQYWIDVLMRGAGEASVVLGFVASGEYQQLHPDPASLRSALSLEVLGTPNAVVNTTATDVADVAPAYLLDAVKPILDSYYALFLHRQGDPLEAFWLAPLQNSLLPKLALEATAVGFLTSSEFLADVTHSTFPTGMK
jgi:hypothetical protein